MAPGTRDSVIVVLTGGCELSTAARSVAVPQSFAAVVLASQPHALVGTSQRDSWVLQISLSPQGRGTVSGAREPVCALRLEDSYSYYLVSRLISLLATSNPAERTHRLIDALSAHCAALLRRQATVSDRTVAALVRHIESIASPVHCPSELADLVHLHPMTISRKFREYTGCSIGLWRQRVRAERAFFRVIKTREGLAQVSQTAGFSDQSHMNRSFRRFFGLSPGQVRALLPTGMTRPWQTPGAPAAPGGF